METQHFEQEWQSPLEVTYADLVTMAPLSHLHWEQSTEQLTEAVNPSWPVNTLYINNKPGGRSCRQGPFHSITAGSTWRWLVAAVKHASHSQSRKRRDKCIGNPEWWGWEWVTTEETGSSPCHLHISSEEGWPAVSQALEQLICSRISIQHDGANPQGFHCSNTPLPAHHRA